MENVVNKQVERPKYIFIEVLRIVACFLVIVNHTNSTIFLNTWPSPTWFASLTYFFISKMAVPIFVMISGFTMLDKQDDYKKCRKRVLRVVLAVIVFSVIYYLYQWKVGIRQEIGVADYFFSIYQSSLSMGYWYLYMYAGLLLMMPFLQKLVAALNKRDCQILIGLSLLMNGTWPILEYRWPFLQLSDYIEFALFDSYIGLLLIGYYMKKYVTPSKKLLILSIIGFVASLGFNVYMTYLEYWKCNGVNYLFYDNRVYLPILLEGICTFYIMMHIQWKGRITKVLKVLGGCTFGIFLLQDYFVIRYVYVFQDLCAKGYHPILAVFWYEVLIFTVGFVLTFVLKKIPLLKKLL